MFRAHTTAEMTTEIRCVLVAKLHLQSSIVVATTRIASLLKYSVMRSRDPVSNPYYVVYLIYGLINGKQW